jgi:hypothetical protein
MMMKSLQCFRGAFEIRKFSLESYIRRNIVPKVSVARRSPSELGILDRPGRL